MINRKILNKYKGFLIKEKFKIGDKYFYFEGCDSVEIKFSHRITGIDTEKVPVANIWVRYENLNPNVEEQIIKQLRKNGVSEVI